MAAVAHINGIATATPANEVHRIFVDWAEARLSDRRDARLFRRMVERAGIERRWSVLAPTEGASQVDPGGFYHGTSPTTAHRMAIYAEAAPVLAEEAARRLGSGALDDITHLVVASCTGFIAPGVDQILASRLGLAASVQRTLIGFMGCYAGAVALRTARQIVQADGAAKVLVVAVELCTLHLQHDESVEPLLGMLLFGDGAAAAIVSGKEKGFAITRSFAAALPESHDLIRWDIGDTGFRMHLSGAVPGRIGAALAEPATRAAIEGAMPVDRWAVHAGGRSVLDAVERALDLPAEKLAPSRAVLAEYGNVSSATLLFVLERMLREGRRVENGVAVAFGPGLAAEGIGFRTVP
jgi:predicted naringenin-chalcone synthase